MFGRYPSKAKDKAYPVYDLVMCHGDFLNADHGYIHKNKNLKGFGSYGDIMIRDRKMYVAPTPFALTNGTERQITLLAPEGWSPALNTIKSAGICSRKESAKLIRGYAFDLVTHKLTARYTANPNAGKTHVFKAYRTTGAQGPAVGMR